MPELKTKATSASVTAFLETVDELRRADCKALVKLLQAATGSKPKMWGPSIIGFGEHAYKNAAGKSVDWFVAGFSPRKRDLTLYLMPGVQRYPEYLAKLGPHSTGKSCLYIKRLDDVDVKVLERLVTAAVKCARAMQ
jgi:hypothetical protein